ncbi:hypothetical protein [Nonomuraea insulae]|uniref:Exo-alpha-sialidase n=1 Tax=Nonomuraea insulae TaxID=1616787 RepID=A0ABW1CDX4_9ACTN
MLVLLINDHLLKQAWPGIVTGKLSDVAGLVVAPALVALLFWRRADLAATVLTGVLFALVKSTETGAELASQAWTLVGGPSRVLADPTDLLALPALALAWWVRGHSVHLSPRWLVVVMMPLTVFAVTATSGTGPTVSAEAVEVGKSGRISVYTDSRTSLVSDDGGRTWSSVSGERTRQPQSAQCAPAQATRCYQVVKGRMAVEESDDGGRTWRSSWKLSGDDLERLTRQHDRPFEPRSTALAVQARPGGHVVVVANGLDGIVVRDTSGTWRRVGWPGASEPAEVNVDSEWRVALFLAVCMLFGGVWAGLRQFSRVYTGFAVAACLGLLAVLNGGEVVSMGEYVPYADTDLLPLVGLGLLAVLVGTVVCLVLTFAGKARPVPTTVGILASPLVYASVYLPFAGWSAGTPESYTLAVAIAVLLTALVLLASAVLIRNDARRANPYFFDGSSTSSPT